MQVPQGPEDDSSTVMEHKDNECVEEKYEVTHDEGREDGDSNSDDGDDDKDDQD